MTDDEIRVLFLCGCNIRVEDIDSVDTEGFVNCPIHPGYRRYGWRTRRRDKVVEAHPKSDPSQFINTVDYGISLEESERLFWQDKGISLTETTGSYRILNPWAVDS